MNWQRMAVWVVVAVVVVPFIVTAQERQKAKNKGGPNSAKRVSGGGLEFTAAKVSEVAQGKITFESDGQKHTLPVALGTKFYDEKGKEYDPVSGSVRFLAPGNIVAIKTKPGGRGEPRVVIAEVRFVSGKVGELPPGLTEPRSAKVDLPDLKPDPKHDGLVVEIKVRESDWDGYFARASVGDFVVYQRGSDPARREIVEVGEDYVLEAKVFYILGTRDEDRIKHIRLAGAAGSAEKKSAKAASTEPAKSAKSTPARNKATTSKSRSKLTPAQLRDQAKNKKDATPPRPTSETITVAGRAVECTIRRTAGGFEEWLSPDVPFDGKVKDNSRLRYTLLDFGWGE